MKRPFSLLLLSIAASLASCGGSSAPSSSMPSETSSGTQSSSFSTSVPPSDPNAAHIEKLHDASKRGFSSDNVAIKGSNASLSSTFAVKEDDAYKNYSLRLDPMIFDMRLGGLNATSVSGVHASMDTLTDKSHQTKLFLDGVDMPSELKIFGDLSKGIAVGLAGYFDDGAFYADFSNAGLLRAALNYLFKAIDKDFAGHEWAKYSKYTLGEKAMAELEKALPLSNKFASACDEANAQLLKMYETAAKDFAFSVDAGVTTVSFSTKEWSSLRGLFDSFLDVVKESTSLSSSPDSDSILAELEKRSTIGKCDLSVSFAETGVTAISADLALTFKEDTGDAAFKPVGTWSFKGTAAFTYGEEAAPKRLSDRSKSLYEEITFPEFDPESLEPQPASREVPLFLEKAVG